ncbi:hypothetical protein MASSI9I_70484 [Massilia sp. 9I]|nr:hypothetical protein MASSI9I_70484 [Massilia sp. 9I]
MEVANCKRTTFVASAARTPQFLRQRVPAKEAGVKIERSLKEGNKRKEHER